MQKEAYGFPVVNAGNVFSVLEGLGIEPWPREKPYEDGLAEYREHNKDNEEARLAVGRFAPRVKVRHLLTPTGKSFPGFYVDNWTKDWATTLVLLPGNLVVLTGEYKHGQDEVVIVPPSGVPKRGFTEEETMMGCATREFKEETGLTLTSIVPLGGPQAVSARNINCRYFPFLGEVAEPIVAEEVQRDITERLAVVLCPIEEWFTLIKLGRGIEQCSASIAFLYMLAQGRLGRA